MVRKKDIILSRAGFDAVIFDLDGVVTDTANVHAKSWKRLFDNFLSSYSTRNDKPFKPFETDTDYRIYVDGKPRFDGVRSFLMSRGIRLPEGSPDDVPGKETIYGLGKLKNEYFLKYIQDQGVDVYESTVDCIHDLKKHGFKTAIISSSKNCAMILDSGNLSDLFDVRVDGVDSEILGIAGKPAPDIFIEAARQLKVKPERAVVIEDAISGVQAGRAGGIGMVIGVDRTGNRESLLKNGADAVVEDLSGIAVTDGRETLKPLPSALDRLEEIARLARGKRIAVFLDYDGTLTPIADTPDKAVMSEDMRQTVTELSQYCTVGIISGRDLKDVRSLVNIDTIIYAGSHGFDISGPAGLHTENQVGTEYLPVLDKAEQELSRMFSTIKGVLVERKRFAIAIHYRLVAPEQTDKVEEIVDKIAARHPELRKTYGKKIFELQPDLDWNKGKALLSLLTTLGLNSEDVLPFYIGDDVTDEDALRAIEGRGIGIVVWDEPYKTAATYCLHNPGEVREFLLKLIPLCKGGNNE
ncbi:MAG: trehalose-phosphatase [Candidatus Loosdrechtia sp.]|uniref:trehalose-phosphatase n=1 Tax=Candidatus Loosdrechtia sp. TaxID=3101272 RepID=UPI003A635F3F|nr:MAG: trehalose-phosphatase [Candidatus Jettenia sp. AMX2]